MKYAELGKTGIYVSRICLGTMTFGGADNAAGNAIGRLTGKEADIIVGEALDAGINFIDTADVYGSGVLKACWVKYWRSAAVTFSLQQKRTAE